MKSYIFKTKGCCYLEPSSIWMEAGNLGFPPCLPTLKEWLEQGWIPALRISPLAYGCLLPHLVVSSPLPNLHCHGWESITVSSCLGDCHWCHASEGLDGCGLSQYSFWSASQFHWSTDPSPLASWSECTNSSSLPSPTHSICTCFSCLSSGTGINRNRPQPRMSCSRRHRGKERQLGSTRVHPCIGGRAALTRRSRIQPCWWVQIFLSLPLVFSKHREAEVRPGTLSVRTLGLSLPIWCPPNHLCGKTAFLVTRNLDSSNPGSATDMLRCLWPVFSVTGDLRSML